MSATFSSTRTGPRFRGPALALALSCACSPAASSVPFANAEPEGPEVYYYGDARVGGKTLPGDDRSEETNNEPKKEKTPSPDSAPVPTTTATAAVASASSATPEANRPESSFEKLPGKYSGTDTLTIDFPGFPQRVEKDDKAKLVVEADDANKDRFTFDIIDSSNGESLCSVVGTAKQTRIEFEPGQTCLQQILGMPMVAKLESGHATLEGNKLTVMYDIKLEVDTPSGPQEGSIDYRFDGERK